VRDSNPRRTRLLNGLGIRRFKPLSQPTTRPVSQRANVCQKLDTQAERMTAAAVAGTCRRSKRRQRGHASANSRGDHRRAGWAAARGGNAGGGRPERLRWAGQVEQPARTSCHRAPDRPGRAAARCCAAWTADARGSRWMATGGKRSRGRGSPQGGEREAGCQQILFALARTGRAGPTPAGRAGPVMYGPSTPALPWGKGHSRLAEGRIRPQRGRHQPPTNFVGILLAATA
jgi:hypothetical protein